MIWGNILEEDGDLEKEPNRNKGNKELNTSNEIQLKASKTVWIPRKSTFDQAQEGTSAISLSVFAGSLSDQKYRGKMVRDRLTDFKAFQKT